MTSTLYTLHTAGTIAANGATIPVAGYAQHMVFYVKTSAGVSGGTILIEEADETTYAGTWALVTGGTINPVAASLTYTFHAPAGSYRAIRARISVGIVGGSVDVLVQVSS